MKISTFRKALVLFALIIAVAIPAAALSGSGTSTEPYQVATLEDLEAIADNPSAYYKLTANIVVNDPGVFEFENGVISGVKDGAAPKEWTPIDFSGSFVNGGSYYITGIYVTEENANGGLFGTLTNATVDKIYMEFALIESDEYAGIIAGKAEGTTKITNVVASGSVVGMTTKEMNTVGGIVGLLGEEAEISASVSYADVTGATSYSAYVGGIAGLNYGEITQSGFGGNVYGTATYYDAAIGGIAGHNVGTVDNCRTDDIGTVGGESTAHVNDCYVGGIVGLNKGTVEYNVNEAAVSAENYSTGDSVVAVGGVVGATIDADVYENMNTGAINGKYVYAGGIAGIAVSDTGVYSVESCDNSGAVTSGYGVAGGIVGRAVAAGEGYVSIKLYVQECNNTGVLTGNATGEVAGETGTIESAQVIIGEEASSYSNVCAAKPITVITADAVQYGSRVTGTVEYNSATARGTRVADTDRYIIRYVAVGTQAFVPESVLVTLITVKDASKVEILSVDTSGLALSDTTLSGNVVVKVYRPENDKTLYPVVVGTSAGSKFADVDFAAIAGEDRITEVKVPVDCTVDAGTITINALVVNDTDAMDPVCENKKVTK